jgi:ABC-2 type transport system permease protein
MTAALAITKRELRSAFNSPVAYIIITAFMLFAGYFFCKEMFLYRQAELRGFLSMTPWLFAFFVPAATMRLLAEEKGSGTLELLITMPVRDWDVVLGKFLAALGLLAVLVALTIPYGVTLAFLGPLDKGPAVAGYIGIFLMCAAFAGIGLMASALTRNQVVAFIVGLAISLALCVVGIVIQVSPEPLQPILSFLAVGQHLESINRGVLDSRDIIYFLSIIAVTLVVAKVSIESRKWK